MGRGGGGGGGMAAGFHHDDRLVARRRTRGGEEFSCRGDALHIQQHRLGFRVGGDEIQHVAEIHIRHVAERDQIAKSDAARRRPVQQRDRHRAGLGEAGDRAGPRLHMAEAGVHAGGGRQQTQAVRPDDAQQSRARGVQHRLAPFFSRRPAIVAGGAFAKARGDHHRAGAAARRQRADQAGNGVRRRGDDGKVGDFGQSGDIGKHR